MIMFYGEQPPSYDVLGLYLSYLSSLYLSFCLIFFLSVCVFCLWASHVVTPRSALSDVCLSAVSRSLSSNEGRVSLPSGLGVSGGGAGAGARAGPDVHEHLAVAILSLASRLVAAGAPHRLGASPVALFELRVTGAQQFLQ